MPGESLEDIRQAASYLSANFTKGELKQMKKGLGGVEKKVVKMAMRMKYNGALNEKSD